MPRPAINKARMDQLRAQVAEATNNIRNDKRYSAEGKRNAIASAYRQARREAQQLRDQHIADTDTFKRTLERDLFGLPKNSDSAAIMAYRDAQDRVAALDGEDACTRAAERARITGDEHMMRALLHRAFDRAWLPIIYAADAENPGVLDKAKELGSLPDERTQNLENNVGHSIRMPEELGAASDRQIDQWADAHEPAVDAPRYVHM
ncbi:hypothetical protein [Nocardia araoensis]|uniref:hypothetical protein n=1 Tax=Nocardia araoensis TaxID=228600 RepID=UPI00031C672B|nr:hypothetical protein [Nocardia araoensis]